MKLRNTLFIAALCAVSNLFAGSFSITTGNGYQNKTKDCLVFEKAEQGSITFSTDSLPLRHLVCLKEEMVDGTIKKDTISVGNYILSADSQKVTINNIGANIGYRIVYYNYSYGDSIQESAYSYVVNYQPLTSVKATDSLPCNEMELNFEPVMTYINQYGNSKKLDRELSISYDAYGLRGDVPSIENITCSVSASDNVSLDSIPYTDTKFVVTDLTATKVLKMIQSPISSDTVTNRSVVAFPKISTTAKKIHEADNSQDSTLRFFSSLEEAKNNSERFRHSAPLTLELEGYANDVANHYEWAFASGIMDGEDSFDGVYTYFDKYVNSFVIEEPGLHCIRLWVSNIRDEDTCSHKSYVCFQVTESNIVAPNAFTPNGDGTNDEFRVSYRSIAEFEISIYDQWGRRVYQSNDITQGWDGTYHGKNSSIGTYFYVIKARGTDDTEFLLKGDVNLIRSKK